MAEINLDSLPKTVKVADLIALLGEGEAKRLVAGVEARKTMPRYPVSLDQVAAIESWLDGQTASKADESLVANGLRGYFLEEGTRGAGPASRRRRALRLWLVERKQALGGANGQAPPAAPVKRKRRVSTDPEVIAKRNAALAKARATRAERLAEQRAAAVN